METAKTEENSYLESVHTRLLDPITRVLKKWLKNNRVPGYSILDDGITSIDFRIRFHLHSLYIWPIFFWPKKCEIRFKNFLFSFIQVLNFDPNNARPYFVNMQVSLRFCQHFSYKFFIRTSFQKLFIRTWTREKLPKQRSYKFKICT